MHTVHCTVIRCLLFTSLMTALTVGEVERPLLAILLTKAILLSLERQVKENIGYLILFKTPSKTTFSTNLS